MQSFVCYPNRMVASGMFCKKSTVILPAILSTTPINMKSRLWTLEQPIAGFVFPADILALLNCANVTGLA